MSTDYKTRFDLRDAGDKPGYTPEQLATPPAPVSAKDARIFINKVMDAESFALYTQRKNQYIDKA